MTDAARGAQNPPASVSPDPSRIANGAEGPLRALVLVAAALGWAGLVASVVGFLAMFVWVLLRWGRQLVRVATIRGSAVKVGPGQLPQLDLRVRELCQRMGLEQVPDVYVVRDAGASEVEPLCVFGERILLVDVDLVDPARAPHTRDFCIAHELAAFRADQLRWRGLLAPGLWVPCLGAAYLRACVYTRDRYAQLATGFDRDTLARSFVESAMGTRALGASAQTPPDPAAWLAQRADLETIWSTLGEWLSSTPTRVRRLQNLDLVDSGAGAPRRPRAVAWIAGAMLVSSIGGTALVFAALGIRIAVRGIDMPNSASFRTAMPASWDATAQVESSLVSLAAAAEAYRGERGVPPPTGEVLYQVWQIQHPGEAVPVDPYDEQPYGYSVDGNRYVIWSSGPDLETEDDDISYVSPEAPGGLGAVTSEGSTD